MNKISSITAYGTDYQRHPDANGVLVIKTDLDVTKALDGLIEKICSEGRVPCAHAHWPGFSISNGYEMKHGFDYFIDTHHDRELRDLQALKVKRQLRRDWGCLSGDDAKRQAVLAERGLDFAAADLVSCGFGRPATMGGALSQ